MASALHFRLASKVLGAGGVIAYPTEGVWGLGCDPDDDTALLRLLELKGRDPGKGLILIAADLGQVKPWLQALSDEQRVRLTSTWPGPVSWVVPHDNSVSPLLSAGRPGLALRVSAHPVVKGICRAFGGPIVSTSANPSGLPAATRAWTVRRYFGTRIDLLVPGRLGGQRGPTPIRDLTSDKLLRK